MAGGIRGPHCHLSPPTKIKLNTVYTRADGVSFRLRNPTDAEIEALFGPPGKEGVSLATWLQLHLPILERRDRKGDGWYLVLGYGLTRDFSESRLRAFLQRSI